MAKQGGPRDINKFILVLLLTISISISISAMMHNMPVFNSMWSCAVSTVVYQCNRTFVRGVGLSDGAPITLHTFKAPDASKFRVLGCIVFAKVADMPHRTLGEKAFRGDMVGYPPDAPKSRVYNYATRRITTSVHVVFQEDVLGFKPSTPIHSMIPYASNTANDHGHVPHPHPLDLDKHDADDAPRCLMMETAHTALDLTQFATGVWWPIYPTTLMCFSPRAVTLSKVRQKRTLSNNPTWRC
jgi:hypothetical protein